MSVRFAGVPAFFVGSCLALVGLAVACDSTSPTDEPGPASSGGTGNPGGGVTGNGGSNPASGGVTTTGGASNSSGGASAATNGGSSGAAAPGGAGSPAGGVVATGGGPVAGSPPLAGAGSGGGGAPSTPKPAPTLIGDVAFSTPSQSFKAELSVSLSTVVANAEIRYTTDGTVPTAASTLYPGTPLVLTGTTQLRAQAFVAGLPTGSLSTAVYIARTFDLTSDLPIILVDGYGKGKPTDKEVSLDAAVMVFEPSDGMASLTVLPTLAARAGYHVRGQSSANFPQTPYKIELWDNANKDSDYAVLGMPADSDWALIPPYYDRALVRNPFVYTLGEEIGLDAPRTAYAEVYLNYEARPIGDADYQGIYWVSETIKNNKDRTNLKQLKETDTMLPQISGGYIFKFDQLAAEEPKLLCTGADPIPGGFGGPGRGGGRGGNAGTGNTPTGTCWTDLEVVDPEPLNAEQQTWLTQHIQQFHDTLHMTPIGDYAQFIDVPSFVDYLIINELTRNVDAYVRSAYYHKDRDGKLKAGPLWDYNFSLAVGGMGTIDPAGGFQYAGTRNINNWYPKLVADPVFMTAVKTRWKELRQGLFSDAALDQRVTTLAAPLTNAVVRDFAKWPVSSMYGSGTGFVVGPTVATWAEQIQALRTYLLARTAWLDSQYQ
jgi:hypothetical protein